MNSKDTRTRFRGAIVKRSPGDEEELKKKKKGSVQEWNKKRGVLTSHEGSVSTGSSVADESEKKKKYIRTENRPLEFAT